MKRPGRRSVGTLLITAAALLAIAVVTLDTARFARAPQASVAPPATLEALLEQGSQERHALYAYLRVEAPGARIIIDRTVPGPTVDPLSLRTLGATGPIEHRPIGDGALSAGRWIPDTPPDVQGRLMAEAWEVHREPGAIDTVLVGRVADRTVLVDRRSVPALAIPRWDTTGPAPTAPTLTHAVTVETLVIVALIVLGGLVLPRTFGTHVMRPALGLLAGAAVQAVTSFVFLAGTAAKGAGLLLAIVVHRRLHARGIATGWTRQDLPALALTTLVVAATALVVRVEGLVIVSADAIAHVTRAIALGEGTMGLVDLNEKRPLALAAINAPAHALGSEGLHAFGWVMLLAVGILLVTLPFALRAPGSDSGRAVALGAGAVTLALAAQVPLLRTMAAFLNTHLLVGALLLLLVAVWVYDSGATPHPGIAPIGVITLLALVPTRAESVLVVGLVLLASLAVRSDPLVWPWAWTAVGAGLAAWNGLHVAAALTGDAQPSFPVAALTVLGIATLAVRPVVARLRPALRQALARTILVGAWIVLLALLTSTIGSGASALEGLRVNLAEGEGAWGVFAPVLVVLVVLGLVAGSRSADRRLVLARWFVLGAVPSVLLAKAADGTQAAAADGFSDALGTALSLGARVGSWGDSANRMWVHFALVALAFVAMTAAVAVRDDAPPAEDEPRERSRSRRAGVRPTVAVLVGAGTLALLLPAWAPTYLGPVAPATTVPIVEADSNSPASPGAELVAGLRRTLTVTVPPLDLPDDARDIVVCARFRFTDLGRIVTGKTVVGLAVADGAPTTREFDEFAWSGERVEELCIADRRLRAEPLPVVAWAEGGADATAGSSAVSMHGGATEPVEHVVVRYVARSEDTRSPTRRAASVLLRGAIEHGPAVVAGLGLLGVMLLAPAARAPHRR